MRQAGDICAVSSEGHSLTDVFYFELKHVKKLALDQFIVKNTGPLAKFWKIAKREASKHNKYPVIIARQNGWPDLIITESSDLYDWREVRELCNIDDGVRVCLLSDMLTTRF